MRPQPLLILTLISLLVMMPLDHASAASLGRWTSTTSYPIHVAGDACVTYSDYVYCVGGFDGSGKEYNNVYFAQLSTSGIGSWSASAPYPAEVDSAGCFAEAATIYCVGGENSTSVLRNVYTASISPSGLGRWSSATPFPQTSASPSCVVYSVYVYCVGGFNFRRAKVRPRRITPPFPQVWAHG